MGKNASSLSRLMIPLLSVCLVASVLLGLAYTVTLKPKADAGLARQLQSIQAVLPRFDNNPFEEQYSVPSVDGGDSLACFPASLDGKPVGVAVRTWSALGYSGMIRLIVGFDAQGNIFDISVLEQKETPGLGAKMVLPEFRGQFKGRNPGSEPLKVRKDGGDIDAITAATISSRAFADAVRRAYESYFQDKKQSER